MLTEHVLQQNYDHFDEKNSIKPDQNGKILIKCFLNNEHSLLPL